MEKMAIMMANVIPTSLGRFLPIIIGILSVPLALLFDTDSYFYGLLPVLVSVGNQFGVNPAHIAIAMVVCRNCATFISGGSRLPIWRSVWPVSRSRTTSSTASAGSGVFPSSASSLV